MAVFNNVLAGAAGSGGAAKYTIENSLRFNAGTTGAHLSRTFGSGGNRSVWTYSTWVKFTDFDVNSGILEAPYVSGGTSITDNVEIWISSGTIRVTDQSSYYYVQSAALKDSSAWGHLMIVLDTSKASNVDRLRFYWNGEVLTGARSTAITQWADLGINKAGLSHKIGQWRGSSYIAAYLAETYFIDGVALPPSAFAQVNEDTGAWDPIEYAYEAPSNTLNPSAPEAALIIKADGATISGSVQSASAVKLYTSSNGSYWNYIGSASISNIGEAKYLAIGGGGTNARTFIASDGATYTTAEYAVDTAFDTAGPHTTDVTGLTYSANGTVTAPTGTTGFFLNYSDNSSVIALGTDSFTNGNNWTVNSISNTPGSPSAGYDNNGGTPYWIDVLPKNAGFSYNSSAGYLRRVTDGDEATHVYWVGTTGVNGGIYDIKFDLRDFPTITSLRLHHNWLGYSGAYDPYSAELLDANKQLIPGTKLTLDHGGASAATKDWESMTVSGTPRYLRIYADPLTSQTRLYLYQIEINGTSLNSTAYSGGGANATAYPDGDFVQDSPTNGDPTLDLGLGGQLPANYCTLNPLQYAPSATYGYAKGNLEVEQTNSYSNRGLVTGTFGMTAGVKWYFEVEQLAGSTDIAFGICREQIRLGMNYNNSGSYAYCYVGAGYRYLNGSATASWGATYTTGDIIGVAYDGTNGDLKFYKNGKLQGNAATLDTSYTYFPFGSGDQSGNITYKFNFGQRPFAFPLSGYKCLCTANLPDPDILDGSTAMDVALYTGNGTSQTISDLKFSPDFVWIKNRVYAANHRLYDTVRGASKELYSDLTLAEATDTEGLNAFTSDGFSVGSRMPVNRSSDGIVAWAWDAGTPPTRTHTQPAFYSSSTLYTTAADVVANATARNGGDVITNEYVYLVTNSGGRIREDVFSTSGSLTSPWYMLLREGASWVYYGSYGTAEPTSFKWRQDFVPGNSTYTCANNVELHLISSGTSPAQVSVTLPTLATTSDDGAVADTNGTIESRVRADQNKGFSVVTYSGNGVDSSVGHGLNRTPQLIMVRSRNGANWVVHHRPYSETNYGTNQPYFHLNTNLPVQATVTRFTSTFPTPSVFSVGTASDVNSSGADYVAYCWSEIPGYSKFGWFTGNYLADGPYTYTGFRPRWILIKSAGTNHWAIVDTKRLGYNNGHHSLVPDSDVAENYYTNYNELDVFSNGFKVKARGIYNEANKAIIWAAFAENPFKHSRAF